MLKSSSWPRQRGQWCTKRRALEAKTLRTVSHPGEPSTVPQVGPAASHQTSVVPHVRGKPFKMLYGCVFTGFCKRQNPASPAVNGHFPGHMSRSLVITDKQRLPTHNHACKCSISWLSRLVYQLQAYHSSFNEEVDVRQVGNMSVLPIRTKIRGPAPISESVYQINASHYYTVSSRSIATRYN